jgi:anti-anti-sigma factor
MTTQSTDHEEVAVHELTMWVDTEVRPMRVVATGDLDLEGGDRLEALVSELVRRGYPVALDLSAVGFMDSSGLGAVLSVSQVPGRVVLDDASPAVLRVLEVTGTRDVLALGPPAVMRGRLAHVWREDPARVA